MKRIEDVVRWRLCVGCGACAYLTDGAVEMVDDGAQGLRPVANGPLAPGLLDECLQVCPALGTAEAMAEEGAGMLEGLDEGVGPVLEVWEGHAVDREIRHMGSSGGVLTALAVHALRDGGMHGVLQVAADPWNPLRNRTVMSRTKEELLANTGSRYAPASVCDGLKKIEDAPAPCVFIGQPSEVAALRKVQALRPALARNVGVVLSFFCAGSPATRGTLELLQSRGIDPVQVERVRYRGRGWPGKFAVWLHGDAQPALEMSYAESWGFVQAYRPWGVQLWPDGLGEHADIACGDPWDREVQAGDSGSSLVVVRTAAGRRLVRAAMAAGDLELRRSDVRQIVASQRALLRKKGAVWGRLTVMRLLGLPVPAHAGGDLLKLWLALPLREKLRSTVGTLRRILARKYYRPDAQVPPSGITPGDRVELAEE